MKGQRVILPLAGLTGSGLVAAGLQSPLVEVPVVGTIMFGEHAPGGEWTGWLLVGVLMTASILLAVKSHSWIRRGSLLAILGVGTVIGLLVSIYRNTMAQVMEIADLGNGQMDEGVRKLLEQMKYGNGAYLCICGMAVIAFISLFSVLKASRPSR